MHGIAFGGRCENARVAYVLTQLARETDILDTSKLLFMIDAWLVHFIISFDYRIDKCCINLK